MRTHYENFDDPTAEAEVDHADSPQAESGAEALAVASFAEAADADVARGTHRAEVSGARKALRELEAAKARVERDAQKAADELRGKLIAELLPVLDNLDRTIHAANKDGESPSVLEGVRMVRGQMVGMLARYGVERIDAKHHRFDPRIHDAISIVPVQNAAAHEMVIDQIEPGYRFGDRLLRPAKVVVGRLAPRYH